MAKLTLTDLASLANETSAINTINNNNALTETALENTLSRDGTTPNTMGVDIDMDSNDLLNVGVVNASQVKVGGVDAALLGDVSVKGVWTTFTSYVKLDLVSESGSTYICMEDHTSGTFVTDLAAVKWSIVSSASSYDASNVAITGGTIDGVDVTTLLNDTDAASYQPVDADLTAIAGLTSAANKIPMFSGSGTATLIDLLDEDTMSSDSATAVPTQQSVKAYVDAEGGGGKALQVLQTVKSDTATTSSTSFADITGVSQVITPSATSSKVLVRVVLNVALGSNQSGIFKLLRGATDIGVGDASGSRTQATASGGGDGGGQISETVSIEFLDSPATTSATTYKIQWRSASGNAVYLNRQGTDTNGSGFPRLISTITLTEIGA